MSIDRIGKGSAPPPAPVTGGKKPEGAEAPKAFEVQRPEAKVPAAPVGPVAPTKVGALDRLRAGEIDLDGYLDLKVDEATSHLKGLPASEVAGIRAALRDQITHDPALVDLVRHATGETPATKE